MRSLELCAMANAEPGGYYVREAEIVLGGTG